MVPVRLSGEEENLRIFAQNVFITTAENFSTQSLINSILEVGADRILFSTDYPFEEVGKAARWFDGAAISEADRRKIGRENAIKLFGLRQTSGG